MYFWKAEAKTDKKKNTMHQFLVKEIELLQKGFHDEKVTWGRNSDSGVLFPTIRSDRTNNAQIMIAINQTK